MKPVDNAQCPICLRATHRKDFVSDHCHATGLSRAWICRSCNAGLGMFKDDACALERAIAYLLYHRERHECGHEATAKASGDRYARAPV
jgi:hypothetical protein